MPSLTSLLRQPKKAVSGLFGTGESNRINQAHAAYSRGLQGLDRIYEGQRARQTREFGDLRGLYGDDYLAGTRRQGAKANVQLDRLLHGEISADEIYDRTPGARFALEEGNRQIQRNASLSGLRGSGATGRALINYGQETARGAYNQYVSQLLHQQQIGTAAEQSRIQGRAGVGYQEINLGFGLANRHAAVQEARAQNSADEQLNLLGNRRANQDAVFSLIGNVVGGLIPGGRARPGAARPPAKPRPFPPEMLRIPKGH